MNTTTDVLLVVAGCFAVGNWYSRLVNSRPLEFLTKPTVTALLAIAACTLDVRNASARPWFVAALVLSFVGDVCLMLPKEQFIAGLGAFLLGHVAYIVGFARAGLHANATLIGAVVVAVLIAPVGRTVLRAARLQEPKLVVPVTMYMFVIAAMVSSAIGSTQAWAIGGAALFAFSDSLIAWTRFVRPLRWSGVAIMVTYHLGQFGLLISLARR